MSSERSASTTPLNFKMFSQPRTPLPRCLEPDLLWHRPLPKRARGSSRHILRELRNVQLESQTQPRLVSLRASSLGDQLYPQYFEPTSPWQPSPDKSHSP